MKIGMCSHTLHVNEKKKMDGDSVFEFEVNPTNSTFHLRLKTFIIIWLATIVETNECIE